MDNYETQLQQVQAAYQKAKEEWVRLDASRNILQKQLEEKRAQLEAYYDTKDVYEKVRVLLQQSAEYAREQAKQQIETLVTNALQYVFGPMIEFRIEIEERGSKPIAEFYVISDYEGTTIKTKPQEARGGGVVDIVTLALRVAILETLQPKVTGPLLLDEPGKHVSGDYVLSLYEFLKSLSTMFKRQIIMITHNHHLAESGDHSYRIELKSGISQAEQIDNT